MGRKKLQLGDPGKCNCISIRCTLLLWTALAAWCVSVVNGEVYMIMFNEKTLAQQYATLGAQELDVSAQHDALLTSFLGTANDFRKVHDYNLVFNGVAVDLTESQVALLQSNDAVWRIVKDEVVTISTTHSPDYMRLSELPNGAWNTSGGVANAGEGIVIGVVDTGIYPEHPSFADDPVKPYTPLLTYKGTCATDLRAPNGFCNGKIVGAQYFFATARIVNPANATDPDLNSPFDSNGHGSHCAGTAAGNYGVPVIVQNQNFGNASGTAPRARIAVYKALDKQGQGYTSDIIKAIDQAVIDGVNVLSLSLGSNSAAVGNVTYTQSFQLACLGALKNGVICVHAAGNTGPGTSTVTSFSPWITSVGATTTDRVYPSYLYTGDGRNYSGQGLTPPTPGSLSYPLIKASNAIVVGGIKDPNFDCADPSILNNVLIQGKILVCSWNGVEGSFSGSMSNFSRVAAQTSGAVGVVLLIAGQYYETSSPASWYFNDFPAIAVWGLASYQSFNTYYLAASQNAAGATGWLSGGNKAVYTGAFPKIAPFSSRGPNIFYGVENPLPTATPVADVLKPNIVAPGVDIWSAWSPVSVMEKPYLFRGQQWSMISGTSMAAPHISGISAMIKQKYPTWSPSAIASALSTTANPFGLNNATLVAYDVERNLFGDAIAQLKRPGNAFDFGNGFVDAKAALDPGLIFDATYADYIKFLCSERLLGSAAVYANTLETCPVDPGLSSDLNLPSITIGNLTTSRVVPRTVTNVGLLETYTAYIIKPAGVEVAVVPANFTIAAAATQVLTVTLTALSNSIYVNQSSFGAIYLQGSLGHKVQVPVTVTYKQV
ncbi:hypothetical protein KC19_6G030000 [Ceratodon purpureus]|uniref:Peptidase S8/S53 domain-containing protein n=1 Tax=Ceratodon purpureus TaxID=3225 RepID=A0A8T0HEA1_CERPU|nr:hypothetical protein KC19_6G030000 [Ceratodon purpureus]